MVLPNVWMRVAYLCIAILITYEYIQTMYNHIINVVLRIQLMISLAIFCMSLVSSCFIIAIHRYKTPIKCSMFPYEKCVRACVQCICWFATISIQFFRYRHLQQLLSITNNNKQMTNTVDRAQKMKEHTHKKKP